MLAWPIAARAAFAGPRSASATRRGVSAETQVMYGAPAAVARAASSGGEHDRQVGGGDDREPGHASRARETRCDHQRPAVEAVGDDAAQRSSTTNGTILAAVAMPGPGGGARPLVHEREQGEVVQPVAGLGDGEPRQQAAETRVTERGAKRAHGARVCV